MLNTKELRQALQRIDRPKILVVGDIIADVYIEGTISRISREAPVLIVEQQEQHLVLGGAANAAHNLAELGGQVYLAGIVGTDPIGEELHTLLERKQIDHELVFSSRQLPTCTKTRILAAAEHAVRQQMLRVDRMPQGELEAEGWDFLRESLRSIVKQVDGIHISDYGLPMLSNGLRDELMNLARREHKLILVDSRYQLSKFIGATIVTPNLEEASHFVGYPIRNRVELEQAGWEMMAALQCQAVLITRGPEGMSLFTEEHIVHHLPVYNKAEVADVSGAGDTVASMMILALASGIDGALAAKLANVAAGVVVRKVGTATLTRDELAMEIDEYEMKQSEKALA